MTDAAAKLEVLKDVPKKSLPKIMKSFKQDGAEVEINLQSDGLWEVRARFGRESAKANPRAGVKNLSSNTPSLSWDN